MSIFSFFYYLILILCQCRQSAEYSIKRYTNNNFTQTADSTTVCIMKRVGDKKGEYVTSVYSRSIKLTLCRLCGKQQAAVRQISDEH